MATNEYNSRNGLTRSSRGEVQRSSSNPLTKAVTLIVEVEESIKDVWNKELDKAAIDRIEFDAWDKYDRKHS